MIWHHLKVLASPPIRNKERYKGPTLMNHSIVNCAQWEQKLNENVTSALEMSKTFPMLQNCKLQNLTLQFAICKLQFDNISNVAKFQIAKFDFATAKSNFAIKNEFDPSWNKADKWQNVEQVNCCKYFLHALQLQKDHLLEPHFSAPTITCWFSVHLLKLNPVYRVLILPNITKV